MSKRTSRPSRKRTGRDGSPSMVDRLLGVAPRLSANRRRFWGIVAAMFLVFTGFMALPARSLISQSAELSSSKADLQQLEKKVAALERRKTDLQDPAQIELIARRNHGLVFPGEESYVVLPEPADGGVPGWVATGLAFDPGAAGGSATVTTTATTAPSKSPAPSTSSPAKATSKATSKATPKSTTKATTSP